MFELYDTGSISSGPVQFTGYVYVGIPATEGIYQPGLAAFSIQSNCTLNPTPVWDAKFGPDGARLPGSQAPRSPLSIANGVVYVSDNQFKTEYRPVPNYGASGYRTLETSER
jgi:hypothetical protein